MVVLVLSEDYIETGLYRTLQGVTREWGQPFVQMDIITDTSSY